MSQGIDYGMGQTNIDHETGIRFGVIPAHDVGQAWHDNAEPDYGDPHCPDCGRVLTEGGYKDYKCSPCDSQYWSDQVWAGDPFSWHFQDSEYAASQSADDCDVFVTRSPYYTYAPFCSPCAPGACYLRDGQEDPEAGEIAYCFGHEWFDGGKAPYPVFRVKDFSRVNPVN